MTLKKWTIARRGVQIGALALIASPLLGLSLFRGNLAAGELFGLRLADPLAFLQATLAARLFVPSFLVAAIIIATFYFLLGGRTFCGWVCPVYLLTELTDTLRARRGIADRRFPLSGIRWSFWAVLLISGVTMTPLFELISPIGITTRAIMFTSWQPLALLVAIVAVEVLVARRIWCRSLCPVGGFYSLIGRYSPVRIGFAKERCNGCGDCLNSCPVEEVLTPPLERGALQVVAGDCTRCGRCIEACSTKALTMNVTYR